MDKNNACLAMCFLSYIVMTAGLGEVHAGPLFIPKVKIRPNPAGYEVSIYDREGKLSRSFQSKAMSRSIQSVPFSNSQSKTFTFPHKPEASGMNGPLPFPNSQPKTFTFKRKPEASGMFNALIEVAKRGQADVVFVYPPLQDRETRVGSQWTGELPVQDSKTTSRETKLGQSSNVENLSSAGEEIVASLTGITAACTADAMRSNYANICEELVGEIREAMTNVSSSPSSQGSQPR